MKKSSSTKATALLLAVFLSAAFSVGTVSSTEAFGLGSITGGVKAVGGVVKKGAKNVSKAGKYVGRSVKDGVKNASFKQLVKDNKFYGKIGKWVVKKHYQAGKWVVKKHYRAGKELVRAAKVNGKHLVDKLPSTTGTITTGYKAPRKSKVVVHDHRKGKSKAVVHDHRRATPKVLVHDHRRAKPKVQVRTRRRR